MDIIGTIVNTIEICERIVDYVKDVEGANEDCYRLIILLAPLRTLLLIFKNNLDGRPAATSISKLLDKCLQILQDIYQKLEEANRRRNKLLWPFKKKGISESLQYLDQVNGYITLSLTQGIDAMVEKLHSEVQTLTPNIQNILLNHTETGKNVKKIFCTQTGILSNLSTINSSMNNDALKQLADWISPLDFHRILNGFLQTRTKGTGSWIFNTPQMKDWFLGKHKLLWCKGNPGVGKTVLSKTRAIVVDELITSHQDDACAVLFAFGSYKSQHTSQEYLATFLRQLLLQRHVSNDGIQELLKAKARNSYPTLEQLKKQITDGLDHCSRVFIIVDALDEIFSGTTDFLENIHDILKHESTIAIVTSRPHISCFNPDIVLEVTATEEDIQNFIENFIQNHKHSCLSKILDQGEASLREIVIRSVTKKASGMFLLAQLNMKSLAGVLKESQLLKALKTLPDSVAEAYDKTLEHISQQSPIQRGLAFCVLSWIVLGYRPLSVPELQYALELSEGNANINEKDLYDKDSILSVCGGLVVFEDYGNSSEVKLVHYTAQDYLLKHIRKLPFLSHNNLATACITYLFSLPLPREPPDAVASLWLPRVTDYEISHKFLRYALSGWFLHSQKASDCKVAKLCYRLITECDTLPKLLKSFGTDHQIYYITQWKVSGFTPLHFSAKLGLAKTTEMLLEGEMQSVDIMDGEGRTALYYAIQEGHADVVKLLLRTGQVNLNAIDQLQHTPLYRAVIQGHKNIVELLIDTGQVNADSTDHEQRTLLHQAAARGYTDIVELLLRTCQVNVNAIDQWQRTPLHRAVAQGHEDIAELLLKTHHIDINSKDQTLRTPLHVAVLGGYSRIVELLLKTGRANVNGTDQWEHTPLHVAVVQRHRCIVETLIKTNQVNVNAMDQDRCTPLHWAAAHGYKDIVEILIKTRQVDINAANQLQRTPLQAAIVQGHEEVVELLKNYEVASTSADQGNST